MLGSPDQGFRGPGSLAGATQLIRIIVTDLHGHRDRTRANMRCIIMDAAAQGRGGERPCCLV